MTVAGRQNDVACADPEAATTNATRASEVEALTGAMQRLVRLVSSLGPVLTRACLTCASRRWRVLDDRRSVRVECRSCGAVRLVDTVADPVTR
jgi:hypothetical protein